MKNLIAKYINEVKNNGFDIKLEYFKDKFSLRLFSILDKANIKTIYQLFMAYNNDGNFITHLKLTDKLSEEIDNFMNNIKKYIVE